jgi:hypothetical protein
MSSKTECFDAVRQDGKNGSSSACACGITCSKQARFAHFTDDDIEYKPLVPDLINLALEDTRCLCLPACPFCQFAVLDRRRHCSLECAAAVAFRPGYKPAGDNCEFESCRQKIRAMRQAHRQLRRCSGLSNHCCCSCRSADPRHSRGKNKVQIELRLMSRSGRGGYGLGKNHADT